MKDIGGTVVGWSPQPRQYVALTCPAEELLFGGAAGGGKSDFLLGDALARAEQYGRGFRGVLFRRSYPELEELIQRSYEIYSGLGTFNTKSSTWRFYTGGFLKMRYIEADADVFKYQGHQYCWIGFDELGTYPTDFAWTYMVSRLRSPGGFPCVMRATANPGGPGHQWIKKHFIDFGYPNVIHTDTGTQRSIVFIPSRLEDNTILMQNDPGYARRLDSLPEDLRRALRDGDWDVFAGQAFSEWRRESHVIKPVALDANVWTKFAALDWGYAKPFSLGWWAVNGDGRMIKYREWYGCMAGEPNKGIKMPASEVAAKAWELSAGEGVDQMVCDPAIWSKIDDTPSIADRFTAAGWRLEKADNDRVNGLARLHDLMQSTGEDGRPMLMVTSTCRDFIRTIPMMVMDPRKPEDVDTSTEDHDYDESRYAAMSRFARNPKLVRTRHRGAAMSLSGREDEKDLLRSGL